MCKVGAAALPLRNLHFRARGWQMFPGKGQVVDTPDFVTTLLTKTQPCQQGTRVATGSSLQMSMALSQ